MQDQGDRSDELTQLTANNCGTCTLCCRVMGIKEDGFVKKGGTWCDHCDKGVGCKVYETRPVSCRTFECLWLASQKVERMRMPLEYRPDKTHVVMRIDVDPETKISTLVAFCDKSAPLAWQEEPMSHFFAWYVKRGVRVIVVVGELVYAFNVKTHESTGHSGAIAVLERQAGKVDGRMGTGDLPPSKRKASVWY